MDGRLWSARKRRGLPRIENFDREGHWARRFICRGEAWPILEVWASESGYHLTSLRGNRRLYKKELHSHKWSATYLDFRQEEGGRVTVSAWIHFGIWSRLLCLFLLPAQMRVEPKGYLGIRKRREACNDLNRLLIRYKQHLIIGSERFHWADMDLTTLLFTVFGTLPLAILLWGIGRRVQLSPGLTNGLMVLAAQKLGIWLGIALGLWLVHHLLIVRRWGLITRAVSALVCSVLLLVASLFLATRTGSEQLERQVSHYCLYHYQETKCHGVLKALSVKEREVLAYRLQKLQMQLNYTR